MKAAALINTSAGGAGSISDVCRAIDAFLLGCDVVTAPDFGCGLIRGTQVDCSGGMEYIGRLNAAVDAVSNKKPDFYVVAGGDGFAAYIAARLLKTGPSKPRLIGVAMGTANVGPIISFSAETLRSAVPQALAYEACGAVEAFDGDVSVAFGFNDIVLGNTILGTMDGAVQTLSARAMVQSGQKVPEQPMENIAENLIIRKNGAPSASPLIHTAQIVASTLERENHYGRAVSGMLCYSDFQQAHSALLLSERPLVVVDYDPRGFESPALFAHVLFGTEDEISIEGLLPSALIIADGNPYLRSGSTVSLRYRPNIIQIARK